MYTTQSPPHPPSPTPVDESHRWKQFALMVAHDLKEPIRNMGDCARLLAQPEEESGVDPAQLRTWLMDASDRLQCMLDALLRHARHGGESVQSGVDAQKTLDGILADFRSMLDRTGGSVEALTPLPKVDCGPLGLRVILQNLIENGLKYQKPGVPPVVRISAERLAAGWMFEVTDEGVGMPEGKTIEAVDPFKRFEHHREGLGMGLCHVRHIVEAHGGDIWIESRPQEGAKVAFTLPDLLRTEN